MAEALNASCCAFFMLAAFRNAWSATLENDTKVGTWVRISNKTVYSLTTSRYGTAGEHSTPPSNTRMTPASSPGPLLNQRDTLSASPPHTKVVCDMNRPLINVIPC
jgi:hypothetical protein